jgi:hypothetical protein
MRIELNWIELNWISTSFLFFLSSAPTCCPLDNKNHNHNPHYLQINPVI